MLRVLRGGAARGRWPSHAVALGWLIALQAATGVFFLADIVVDFFTSGGDLLHNLLEFVAVVSLAVCIGFLSREVRRMLDRHARMEVQLDAARGAFHEVMEGHFADWRLTPSERDVALLSIKGLSIAAIAEARQTREGTVKAQLNAIYGKAGVAGRAQLLGVFIDELVDAPLGRDEGAPPELRRSA